MIRIPFLQAFSVCLLLLLFSCAPDNRQVDMIVHNGTIYTADLSFGRAQAMAIDSGRIVAVGTEREILNKYSADQKLDAAGQAIYPGFIDSHCHFVGYGKTASEISLTGTTSWEDCLAIVEKAAPAISGDWIVGRGWDQNDWEVKEFPSKESLDQLFPNRPVWLQRIDGHAGIANSEALRLAGVTEAKEIEGGEIVTNETGISGVLIDMAMGMVNEVIPDLNDEELRSAILLAQDHCFAFGLTTVDDAGLDPEVVNLIDEMQTQGALKMRVYAMLNPTEDTEEWMKSKGVVKTDKLTVRSVKLYGDGALGSRGAALKTHYHDDVHNKGKMLFDHNFYREWVSLCNANGFQVNTHCIGDRANQSMLAMYQDVLGGANDKRWRIEHAQVLTENDVDRFGRFNILPSVQPTHATSDMPWAEDRLGPDRIDGSYAYRSLLDQNGLVLLGTDFPVEGIDPLRTFYAAVFRKDTKGNPQGGWRTEEALSRQQALMGMTIWGAIGNSRPRCKKPILLERKSIRLWTAFDLAKSTLSLQILAKQRRLNGLSSGLGFHLEQQLFSLQSTSISCQTPICTDHSMAGDEHRNRVGTISRSHGTDRK